jgi:N-succinyldiaminopimelate aminotransferase
MNPHLQRLQPYPFERLRHLFEGVTPSERHSPISLGIGEPKHATPAFIQQAITDHLRGLAHYPATQGEAALRQACAQWLHRRYAVKLDAATQVLPVNGSREALFSLAQCVLNPAEADALVLCPNPFYQIYEGAALLGGAQPYFVASDPARNFGVDWASVPEAVWASTRLVFVCSPGNPTGAVMGLDDWRVLLRLSERHGFVIASDECYSEIYFRDEPPLGSLQAAAALGNAAFKRLVALTSLSKRSNVPGMRSGFVAGDADIIKPFLLYRTYHGSAMSPPTQAASIVAWGDEQHVTDNRVLYRKKFSQVTPLLAGVLDVALPDAAFYLWAGVPSGLDLSVGGVAPDATLSPDQAFARALLASYNVTVLPGSFLARDQDGGQGRFNPGAGRIRMALVADAAECVEAALRIVQFVQQRRA